LGAGRVFQCEGEDGAAALDGVFAGGWGGEEGGGDVVEGGGGGEGVCGGRISKDVSMCVMDERGQG
jgi:hypothetical protein